MDMTLGIVCGPITEWVSGGAALAPIPSAMGGCSRNEDGIEV